MLFLRRILQFVATHNISPTPLNYAICFEYIVGTNGKLINAVDLLIKEKKTIDDDSAIDLYKKYTCDFTFESFDKINQNLQSLITQTRDTLAETSDKASAAGANFEEKAVTVASAKTLGDLTDVISEIVIETKGLVSVSQNLKSELDQAHNDMEQLRLELAEVREIATTDALTGLLNRGAFDNALGLLLAQPPETETCLTLLDLDYFKRINDNFGHLVGDNVLKFTARILKKHTEPHHYVARYGGEELAIIMPDTPLAKASEIAEKIRSTMANSRLKRKNSSESIGQVTLSIGISSLKPDDTVDSFINRADNALYKAKESGRNKVINETRLNATGHTV